VVKLQVETISLEMKMHLIFLHGAAGVGKSTIAKGLAKELGFPFLNFQHLASLIGPVFGFSSATYSGLRNTTTQMVIERALKNEEDGIICSVTFDPATPLETYRGYINAAKESDCIGLFVGLTCDDHELKIRSTKPSRRYSDISDLQILEESLSSGSYETPELPGPSITIDSTGESPEQTTQNIIAMLPDSMKKTISF
jgi:broad-specificity NMP kinase